MDRLTAAILLLLPLAAQAEATLSGFAQQNAAFNTVAANPDGQHHKWLEERIRLKLDAGAGDWRLSLKGDIAYDHLGRQEETELREGYADYVAGNWDLRVGRQVVTWGLGDLVFVNDVWPKDHEAMFAGRPMEYLKRGVDAVKLSAYPEFASFELVASPEFRESRTPDSLRFHTGMPALATLKPRRGEAGLRVYRDIAGWDAALYLYRGYQRTPSVRSDGVFHYPELATFGASLSGRAGSGVLNLELARYDFSGIEAPPSQMRALAAWQTQPWEDFSLNLQYYVERDIRTNNTVGVRATQMFLHQTLRLSVYASHRLHDGDSFVNPELRYSFTDRLWGALGANLFDGTATGPFGQLSRDDNLYLQVRYEF